MRLMKVVPKRGIPKGGSAHEWTCFCGQVFEVKFPVQFDVRDEHTRRCEAYQKRFAFVDRGVEPLIPAPFRRPAPTSHTVNARLVKKTA